MTKHFPSVVGFRPADIALSSCSIRLYHSTSNTCPNNLCSRVSINITAVMDFMFDPDTQNLVELEIAWEEALGDEWSGYRPHPVSVAVTDLPTPACQVTLQFLLQFLLNLPTTCQVFTHSNIITFDGSRYDLHKTAGTFLLFEGSNDHESHVRFWNCNSSSSSEIHNVSCACGLVVREGNELAQVDMCNTKHLDHKLPKVRLESLTGRSVQTRVSEMRQGKSLRFEFRSGRVLTVHLDRWGLSLTLQTTGGDLAMTRL